MKSKQPNQTNDSQKFNEAINYFKTSFLQIKQQYDEQQEAIDKIFLQNKEISKAIEKLDKSIDQIFLDEEINNLNSISEEEEEEEEEEFNKDMGTFDMYYQSITFEGEKYKYDQELLYCGKKQLNNALKLFKGNKNKYTFPQGENYCKHILARQQKEDGSLIILNNSKQLVSFFFIYKDVLDLSPTRGWFYDNTDQIEEQIRLLTEEYSGDKYPQGIEYCLSVLKEQLEQNGAVRILCRSNRDKWTRYYFKTRHIKVTPSEKFAWITGKEKLEKHLNNINTNSNDEFYNGKDYCKKIVTDAIKTNGQIFIIKIEDQLTKKQTFYFYPSIEIDYACNAEWWYTTSQKNVLREKKLIEQKERKNAVYPQTPEYCVDLIQEQMKNRKMFHVIVRNTSKDIWLYFKT